jgi:hypothetical protein
MMAENDNSVWLDLKKLFEKDKTVAKQIKQALGNKANSMLNITEMLENNETMWHNIMQAKKRRQDKQEEFYYELDFVATSDELKEVFELTLIYAFVLNIFELPDTDEYDFTTDYLLFCKKIHENVIDPEADQIQLKISVSERELTAVNFSLSQGMGAFSRRDDISDQSANKAILIESFRRRLLKAAGKELDDI